MTERPHLSVLVATHNRSASLMRLLDSLDVAVAAIDIPVQIIVANNGSTDDTGERLLAWADGSMRRVLSIDRPGKSHALNQALHDASGELVAFLDDDEEVPSNWLAAIVMFFAEHDEYAAAIGRVLPPSQGADAEQLAQARRYRTIAFFDGGDQVHDKQTLHGANMTIRRQVFTQVGCFDERLGPGASGAWEDIELGARICRAGLRIGYMPGVTTTHHVDLSRFTDAYFRRHNQAAGRSAALIDRRAWRKALPRCIEALVAIGLAALSGNAERRQHARGRAIRHWTTVRCCWRRDSPA